MSKQKSEYYQSLVWDEREFEIDLNIVKALDDNPFDPEKLLDKTLAGVNPYNKDMPIEVRKKVVAETILNMHYLHWMMVPSGKTTQPALKNEDFNPPMSDYFSFDSLTGRPSVFAIAKMMENDYKPNRSTLIEHLYNELTQMKVSLDNTGKRYALAMVQFHELTGAEVPQQHDWEGLRDQLGSIRNKKIMVTIPRDREVIPRPLSGTTDGIYPVVDPKYFKTPFYHKS